MIKKDSVMRFLLAITFIAPVFLICVGCGDIRPELVDEPEKEEVTNRSLRCHPNPRIYYWRSDDPKGWYWIDENGDKVYEKPPCGEHELEEPSDVSSSGIELGLIADASGMVAPQMWASGHHPVKAGEFHVDDRLDFFFASLPNWKLPHDTDEALYAKIGESNFGYEFFPLIGSSEPWAVMVSIHQVRLGDLIEYIAAMGISEFKTSYRGNGPYTIRLDGAVPDDYNQALVYNDDGKLIAELKLR